MYLDFQRNDDEVPRDVPGEASVRFWDDEPGQATSVTTTLRWRAEGGPLEQERVPGLMDPLAAMAAVDAICWSAGRDELTLADLWVRWW